MSKILELQGQRFDRLTVVKYIGLNDRGKSIWLCLCDCGKEHIAQGSYLKSGNIKSCGCLNREMVQKANTKSGYFMKGNKILPEYRIWCAMKQRCTNPNDKDFSSYGGRGIEVCSEWLFNFNSFLMDMGYKPGKGYTIDRIDVNGNYEQSNCRWATMKVQSNNKRNNKRITIDGVCDSLMNWVTRIGCVSYDTAKARINVHGWDPLKALTTPINYKNKHHG